MPNHCSNAAQFIGTIEDIGTIRGKGKFAADNFVPMPKELREITSGSCTIDGERVELWRTVDGKSVKIPDADLADLARRYGTASWYDWARDNWGTKWGAYDVSEWDDQMVLWAANVAETRCTFDSAWSPPIALFQKISEQFPRVKITLRYCEIGSDFWGITLFKAGEVTEVMDDVVSEFLVHHDTKDAKDGCPNWGTYCGCSPYNPEHGDDCPNLTGECECHEAVGRLGGMLTEFNMHLGG